MMPGVKKYCLGFSCRWPSFGLVNKDSNQTTEQRLTAPLCCLFYLIGANTHCGLYDYGLPIIPFRLAENVAQVISRFIIRLTCGTLVEVIHF